MEAIRNIRIDPALWTGFDLLCGRYGMSIDTAIELFARGALRDNRMPSIIASVDPFYNEYNQKLLRQAMADLDAGKGTVHELIEVEEDA